MAKFHSLKVSDVRKETAEAVSIAFEVPEILRKDYQYLPGQYLTLKLTIAGEELRRSYSICSSPEEGELRIAIKRVTDGKGSNWLNDSVKTGSQLEIMTPMGNFHSPLNASNKKHYVLFAGGSGITPMLSIIKSVLKEEAASRITLIYCNKDLASTIFHGELKDIEAANGGRLKVLNVLEQGASEDIYKGLLDDAKVSTLIANNVGADDDCEYFICGPTPMMKIVESALLDKQRVDKKRVHIEYFTASLEAAKTPAPAAGANMICQVTVIMDGDESILAIESNGPAILDAALDADMDVPFACKGAVCCTCRAKVVEGEVRMDQNFALSEDEVAQGYVLTCQAHPITPVVVVDYDQA